MGEQSASCVRERSLALGRAGVVLDWEEPKLVESSLVIEGRELFRFHENSHHFSLNRRICEIRFRWYLFWNYCRYRDTHHPKERCSQPAQAKQDAAGAFASIAPPHEAYTRSMAMLPIPLIAIVDPPSALHSWSVYTRACGYHLRLLRAAVLHALQASVSRIDCECARAPEHSPPPHHHMHHRRPRGRGRSRFHRSAGLVAHLHSAGSRKCATERSVASESAGNPLEEQEEAVVAIQVIAAEAESLEWMIGLFQSGLSDCVPLEGKTHKERERWVPKSDKTTTDSPQSHPSMAHKRYCRLSDSPSIYYSLQPTHPARLPQPQRATTHAREIRSHLLPHPSSQHFPLLPLSVPPPPLPRYQSYLHRNRWRRGAVTLLFPLR